MPGMLMGMKVNELCDASGDKRKIRLFLHVIINIAGTRCRYERRLSVDSLIHVLALARDRARGFFVVVHKAQEELSE